MICMRERQNLKTGTSTPAYVFSGRSSYTTSARMNCGFSMMLANMHNLVTQANLHLSINMDRNWKKINSDAEMKIEKG